MLFTPLINLIKTHLTVKLVLIFVLFFSAVSILLSSYFMMYHKSLLDNELRKRAQSLAQNLAFNSRNYIFINNIQVTQYLVSGVVREPDIENVFLTDITGGILASAYTSLTGGNIDLPAEIESYSTGKWFPTENSSTRRIIIPIEIGVSKPDSINESIESFYKDMNYQNYPNISFKFQRFAADSDEIIFSALIGTDLRSETSAVMSFSIQNRKLQTLVKAASNGFLSNNGRYLVYTTVNKQPEQCVLKILDRETGISKTIASEGAFIFPVPCFTPDDQHIITTLLIKDQRRLYRIPRHGGSPEQLTFHEGAHWFPRCSNDGKWILYTDYDNYKLYVYNTETKKTRLVFPDLKDKQWGGCFSPDGRQICYIRLPYYETLPTFFSRELTEWEVYVADFPFSGRSGTHSDPYGRKITTTGRPKHNIPDWSPDGKWITFAQRSQIFSYDIWIVPSRGGIPLNLTASFPPQRIGYAVLDVSINNLSRSIEKGNRIAILISLLFIVIGAFGAMFLVKSIVRPVKKLGDAAGAIAHGDFNQKVMTNRSDEIGTLSESFNCMAEQLKITRENLDEGTHKLEKKHHELEKAYRELESLDKAKDDFLSLVSHEFRTPMSSIAAYTEILRYGWVKSKKKRDEFLSIMLAECRRLTRLINDVLDLSKIEAGRMSFKREGLDIGEMMDAAWDELQPLIEKKGIGFKNTLQNTTVKVLGDRDRIIQVLTNIISNAAKYNSKGGAILVSMKCDHETCTISVKDSGKGISKEDIPKVFDRFVQLENINHHSEGTGLGMSISKSIIERLGGRIWIESEMRKGTTVSFTLPRIHDEAKLEKNGSGMIPVVSIKNNNPRNMGQRKILIVDDEKPIRVALIEFVKNTGFTPIEAENGQRALRLVKEQQPALLILDVMMPDISGLEVCRILKNDPETHGIKIIMLSARGQDNEKEEGLQSGADSYITKPFSYEELGGAIKELLVN
ncbi:MAG: response regulator [Candidatus Latescibacteria bacterium]|nr:response regulator [Candidatus Latescibacterota bacterium]